MSAIFKPVVALAISASMIAPAAQTASNSGSRLSNLSASALMAKAKCGKFPKVPVSKDCWVVKNEEMAKRWRRTKVAKCIRHYESGHNYRAVSPQGSFRGAYQFSQSTFDSLGPDRLDGFRANKAPKFMQDLKARRLYKKRGLQPWPTPRRRC